MVHNIEEREAMENRDPFIAGYFTQRVQSGERPKYGYPRITCRKQPVLVWKSVRVSWFAKIQKIASVAFDRSDRS